MFDSKMMGAAESSALEHSLPATLITLRQQPDFRHALCQISFGQVHFRAVALFPATSMKTPRAHPELTFAHDSQLTISIHWQSSLPLQPPSHAPIAIHPFLFSRRHELLIVVRPAHLPRGYFGYKPDRRIARVQNTSGGRPSRAPQLGVNRDSSLPTDVFGDFDLQDLVIEGPFHLPGVVLPFVPGAARVSPQAWFRTDASSNPSQHLGEGCPKTL
jgi:hypothetical protein